MGDSDPTADAGSAEQRGDRAVEDHRAPARREGAWADTARPGVTLACALAAPVLAAGAVLVFDPPAAGCATLLIVAGAVSAVATRLAIVEPLTDDLRRLRRERDQARLELAEQHRDQDIRARLERALRGADTEPTALRVGIRAVAETLPDAEVTLLLSLPDEPRIGWRVSMRGGELADAEPVPGSPTCTALVDGRTVVAHSSSLDACPHLDHDHQVSATCVPLRSDNRSIGSVCISTAPGEELSEQLVRRVEWIVQRTAQRAAEHHAAQPPGLVGRPEPLTGLPGSSALRPHLRNLVRSLSPFCLAVVTVDDHDELPSDALADAALVSVAGVLCDTLRPDDLICRLDGPSFAAVLPRCSADQAVAAMERVRENLALQLTEESVFDTTDDVGLPDRNGVGRTHDDHAHLAITCSAGVVESSLATSLDDIVGLATAACADARTAGGNRVAVARHTAGQP